MNRTKIIEHYKKFMQLDKMQEDYEIDIDWMQAFIEDYNLVNKNDLLGDVSKQSELLNDFLVKLRRLLNFTHSRPLPKYVEFYLKGIL